MIIPIQFQMKSGSNSLTSHEPTLKGQQCRLTSEEVPVESGMSLQFFPPDISSGFQSTCRLRGRFDDDSFWLLPANSQAGGCRWLDVNNCKMKGFLMLAPFYPSFRSKHIKQFLRWTISLFSLFFQLGKAERRTSWQFVAQGIFVCN